MIFSGTDLRDYYYCFKVSAARSHRNALKLPLTAKQASMFKCFGQNHSTDDSQVFYPCLSTLAMGDCNAVELGQRAHVELGIHHRIFSPMELLTSQGRAPRGDMATGIVIDDVILAEQLANHEDPLQSEGVQRLDSLCEAYLQEGLTAHPKKTFRGETRAEFWGIAVDGESGHVRAHPQVGLLEVLAGSWVSVLQVRRRMLSLLDNIYVAQRGRERDDVVQLSKALVQELWLLTILGPVCVSDMRAGSCGEVFLSDASQDRMASVRAKIPVAMAKEIQRHCLARGTWSKLLSPWRVWQRQHGELLEEEELPEGVPLVSHPIWLAIAQCLQYELHHCKMVHSRRHINLLELETVLEVERRLALRRCDLRYLLGSDSQVALAALIKGRSSSFRLNQLLQSSLAVYLGAGIYGNYGFVPSLANVSDDPTRDQAIRAPVRELPEWWEAAKCGDFEPLDRWLSSVGFHPLQVSKVPYPVDHPVCIEAMRNELIEPLRGVQKPAKLADFDSRFVGVARVAGSIVQNAIRSPEVSPPGSLMEEEVTREQKEPDGQTKTPKKMPEGRNEPRPKCHFVGSERVAPPEEGGKGLGNRSTTSSSELPGRRSHGQVREENPLSPVLPPEAKRLVQSFPAKQFFAPGGVRHAGSVDWQRCGFIDLYSGKAEVARQISKQFGVWVLTFDFTHGENQNLLDKDLQERILELIRSGAVLGIGAAPECSSFSRAITPAVRDRLHPYGKPNLSPGMQTKVQHGNQHAAFVLAVVLLCLELELVYWVENPDGSFLWLLPEYLKQQIATAERSYRFDMCRYHTPWRKRTRILTNTSLAGLRELCCGGHEHQVLRGRSVLHKVCWTRVAQTYPLALTRRLAHEVGVKAGLKVALSRKMSAAGCAKVDHGRVGEAKNPGPRPARRGPRQRNPAELLRAPLVSGRTVALQERVWKQFTDWLAATFSAETRDQVFLSAPLGVQILRRYGLFVYQQGGRLYELRHVLVLAQQKYPLLRPVMAPAWQLVSQWEELQPVCHRRPLPEVLFRAMVVLAINWKWLRFAGCLLLAMEGIARIGEVLKARRVDLVLPLDSFDTDQRCAFLRITKPKTLRRGKGRIQHLKIDNYEIVSVLQHIFGSLSEFLPLFPMSASAFRTRWDKLLTALEIPKDVRPTPASVRGGGAIMAYKRGEPIANILWKMRLVSQVTLETYLQELAAESFLVQLPEVTKLRIKLAASFYTQTLKSLG